MKKPFKKFLKLLLFVIIVILVYFIVILVINTAYDFKPTGGEYESDQFIEKDIFMQSEPMSIITWNVGYAGLGSESDFFYDGGKMSRPKREIYDRYQQGILQQIASFDTLDVLLLQEVDVGSRRSFGNNQYLLIEDLLPSHAGYFAKNYDVKFVPMPLFNPMGRVRSGISFFSNKKVVSSCWRAFDGNRSWPLGLFLPDRCYTVSVLETDSAKCLYVFNTHNSAFDDGSLRNSQLDQLYEEMKKAYNNGHPVVAGGDWNLNPGGYANSIFSSGDIPFRIAGLEEVYGPDNSWMVVHDPAYPTNRDVSSFYVNGQTETTILDFFVCSPNIKILEVKTLYDGFAHSDHHPVYMRFELD